tara:strand:- start:74 stop:346 length:273 start_codon:yes stop_codon:yes gene_type:complete
MKKTIILISILILSGCYTIAPGYKMSDKTKSIKATRLYQQANPNAPIWADEIIISSTPKGCVELQEWCRFGKFQKQGDVKYNDFYCSCLH